MDQQALAAEEPFLKKTIVLLNHRSWERLHQLLPQTYPAATNIMKKNMIIFAQLRLFLAQTGNKLGFWRPNLGIRSIQPWP